MSGNIDATTVSHLPEEILCKVFAAVSDTRTRNSLSLVCGSFLRLERRTRTSLTLRGNARDLHRIPTSFLHVTHLDLSFISPWGHALFCSSSATADPRLLALRLRDAFPRVTSLSVYARDPTTLQLLLLSPWPELRHVRLVRWHQRPPTLQPGSDFAALFSHCRNLSSLDLSAFYHWPEDLPPVLSANPAAAASLRRLNLLTRSFTEGFKSNEIESITSSCPNLEHLLVACIFDPRYLGFVGDDTLLAIASNCPKLTLLHLADTSSFANRRDNDGFAGEDARVSRATLVALFSGLPLLEELVLDVCKNVRESSFALEVLSSKCPKLRVLKLGQFHGICLALGSRLDGIALCQGLRSLSVNNCEDLDDMGLIEIGRGCSRLVRFELKGCKHVTEKGLRTMVCLLRRTLIDVKVSCCVNLDTVASLRALEPIRDRIERLHVDCVWNGLRESDSLGHGFLNFDLNGLDEPKRKRQRCKYDLEVDESNGSGYYGKSWDRLQYLSLWIGVGDLLTPLPVAGLEDCPNLEEMRIKVEGDCRGQPKPVESEFGLSILACYPQLSKMQLDCGDTRGYVLTAPSGQMDLSLWERFFLNGIGTLSLNELHYWPPQDEDVNQRSLSLPAAGLLQECDTLRKLFIHGTTHEHFMNFFLKIPNLRDVQLREDYYPAPGNDMSTEMRVGSCSRFEDALNRRQICD
ncbi:F-box/LRR-repeat MAX2 homolog A isoform X2 [Gastrolobium bilobum]|uniref:F-box/LRR-repeat MAX2 homolog A isoform X2 n=1 Tax=Gastrolobium bilobum TaxID=150636 RepID=UPI002AB09FFD|nr:F-box/LRR-repeat MAX2 homolog A isoform X2 [Gastrolobium bilobum]